MKSRMSILSATGVCMLAAVAVLGGSPSGLPSTVGTPGTASSMPATVPVTPSAPTIKGGALSPSDMVKELAPVVGEPINEGFVFLDGRYIDSPYRVSFEGGKIFLNGLLIDSFIGSPSPVRDSSDPGMPPGLTKDSTLKDLDYPDRPGDSWDRQKIRWLESQYGHKEALAKAVEYYKSLPFVKGASTDGRTTIHVVTLNGDEKTMWASDKTATLPTKEQMIAQVEMARRRYEDTLKGGGCLIMSKGLRMGLSPATVRANLPEIIATVKSNLPREAKAKKLEELRASPPGMDGVLPLWLDKFQGSAQLDSRVAELRTATSQPAVQVSPLTTRPAPAMPLPKIYRAPAPTPGTMPAGGAQRIRIIPSTPDK